MYIVRYAASQPSFKKVVTLFYCLGKILSENLALSNVIPVFLRFLGYKKSL